MIRSPIKLGPWISLIRPLVRLKIRPLIILIRPLIALFRPLIIKIRSD